METTFYPMDQLPVKSVDEPIFSTIVLVFDKSSEIFLNCELAFYCFETNKWIQFADDQLELVCWCYIPNPKSYLINAKLNNNA